MAYILQQLLQKSAARYPEKLAVWARGRSLTYRELDQNDRTSWRICCASAECTRATAWGFIFPSAWSRLSACWEW